MSDLNGHRILVTRPAEQAGPLSDAIRNSGGEAVLLPALEIVGVDEKEVDRSTATLAPADIHVFVSPNAVRFGYRASDSASIAVIGPGTRDAILAAGGAVDIVSDDGYDSEHLLAMPELQSLSDKTVRIYRGQSGRELLGQTLKDRGGHIDYVTVYERHAPSHDPQDVQSVLAGWRDQGMSAWTIMSVETLHNLLAAIGDTGIELARETPLISPSSRVIIEAERLLPGLSGTKADGVTAEAMLATIQAAVADS